jgi:hypothetical protein
MTLAADESVIAVLANGPLFRFSDWPNANLPAAGVSGLYAVWRGEEFVYIGMTRGGSKTASAATPADGGAATSSAFTSPTDLFYQSSTRNRDARLRLARRNLTLSFERSSMST